MTAERNARLLRGAIAIAIAEGAPLRAFRTQSELTSIRSLLCPVCDMLHQQGFGMAGPLGQPGSLALCIGCQEAMRVPEDEQATAFIHVPLRDLTAREFIEVDHLRAQIRRVRRREPEEWDQAIARMRLLGLRQKQPER